MTGATLLDAIGLADGQRRKAEAHALLAARREGIVTAARRALLRTLLERGTATADDVRAAVAIPRDVDPVCMGSVPGALARARIIARMGFVPTGRATAHARPVTVWALRDRAAAEAWLRVNPEPAEPGSEGGR